MRRYGANVDLDQVTSRGHSISTVLLGYAEQSASDLLVVGAYSHPGSRNASRRGRRGRCWRKRPCQFSCQDDGGAKITVPTMPSGVLLGDHLGTGRRGARARTKSAASARLWVRLTGLIGMAPRSRTSNQADDTLYSLPHAIHLCAPALSDRHQLQRCSQLSAEGCNYAPNRERAGARFRAVRRSSGRRPPDTAGCRRSPRGESPPRAHAGC